MEPTIDTTLQWGIDVHKESTALPTQFRDNPILSNILGAIYSGLG